jgi:endonuclease G, mitochondrial
VGDAALMDEQLELALAEARRAAERPYYDADADARARDAYWEGVGLDELTAHVTRTHTAPKSYSPARHVYPWVDLQPDLRLESIYSGKPFDVERLIIEDLAIERRIEERVAGVLARGVDGATAEAVRAEAEAAAPFNCEHVVPQSWFAKKEPMRGDLHHLFACEMRCNSFRGNDAYFEFPARRDTVRPECGRQDDNRFEPEQGKGAVARATLYFLVRYPGMVDPAEMPADRLDVLLAWHDAHPVDEYERHRNAAIEESQGNRNPFIDHPEWVERVDFAV